MTEDDLPMDELDRILTDDPEVRPSSAFVRSVMAAVRSETAALEPLSFPWRRLAEVWALGLCGVLLLNLLAWLAGLAPAAPTLETMAELGGSLWATGLPALLFALLGAVLLVYGALEFEI